MTRGDVIATSTNRSQVIVEVLKNKADNGISTIKLRYSVVNPRVRPNPGSGEFCFKSSRRIGWLFAERQADYPKTCRNQVMRTERGASKRAFAARGQQKFVKVSVSIAFPTFPIGVLNIGISVVISSSAGILKIAAPRWSIGLLPTPSSGLGMLAVLLDHGVPYHTSKSPRLGVRMFWSGGIS